MPHELPASAAAATWQLVQAAADGDQKARDAFAQRYGATVQRWLWFRWRHTPLRGFVDDAVQDVFVECFRPRGALSHVRPELAPHGFDAFLRGVVHHVACRVERTEARNFRHRRRLIETAIPPAPPKAGSPEQLDHRWAMERIRAALQQLDRQSPPMHHSLREFLRLHFEREMSVREIAALWREPVNHVHELRRRACRRFRDCLLRVTHDGDRYGPEMGPALLALLA
ncbi:MAG: sigma-70 family RNA polymerase sigma factor [Planctomycetes bacterium]|nr:sigma-70 family RNA polymerase sigma factor [Planctomycetota bacterium]MCB9887808.1 sigma-70 family RNA polymerase sigma factor [Planctomycetota bacterium]